jgi:DNA-directed RNA polymerase specialized sigma24 family protein
MCVTHIPTYQRLADNVWLTGCFVAGYDNLGCLHVLLAPAGQTCRHTGAHLWRSTSTLTAQWLIGGVNHLVGKEDIVAAYDAYANGSGSEGYVFALLLRYAQREAGGALNTRERYYTTADEDAASNAVLAAWEGLQGGKFTGDGAGFFAWFNRIQHLKCIDEFNGMNDEAARYAPLMSAYRDNNPRDNRDAVAVETLADVEKAGQAQRKSPKIPTLAVDDLTGDDLVLLSYLEQHHSYAQIAERFNVMEATIRKRVQRLRDRTEIPCKCRECCQRIGAERKQERDAHQKYRKDHGDAAARERTKERSLRDPKYLFFGNVTIDLSETIINMKTEQDIIWEERRSLYPHHREETSHVFSTNSRDGIGAGNEYRMAHHGEASGGSAGVPDWSACA